MSGYRPPAAPPVSGGEWTPAEPLAELERRFNVRRAVEPETCAYSFTNLMRSLEELRWVGGEVGKAKKGLSPIPFLGACGLVDLSLDGIERTNAGNRVMREWRVQQGMSQRGVL